MRKNQNHGSQSRSRCRSYRYICSSLYRFAKVFALYVVRKTSPVRVFAWSFLLLGLFSYAIASVVPWLDLAPLLFCNQCRTTKCEAENHKACAVCHVASFLFPQHLVFAPFIFTEPVVKHLLIKARRPQGTHHWDLSDWRARTLAPLVQFRNRRYSSKIRYESFIFSLLSGTKISFTILLFLCLSMKPWNSWFEMINLSAFRMASSPAFSPSMRRHWKTFQRTGFRRSIEPDMSWDRGCDCLHEKSWRFLCHNRMIWNDLNTKEIYSIL